MERFETYCTYEQSLRLKRLGFDLPCNAFYGSALKKEIIFVNNPANYNCGLTQSAPTFAMVSAWLRIKNNCITTIHPVDIEENDIRFTFTLYFLNWNDTFTGEGYNSFKDAELGAIDYALMIYSSSEMN